jgi:uncharacterized protein (TIGR03437 family)
MNIRKSRPSFALLLIAMNWPVFGHDAATHKQITWQALEYLSLADPARFGRQATRDALYDLLAWGAEHEDDDYKVQREQACLFINDLYPDVCIGRFNFHFLPKLHSLGASGTCDLIEWALGGQENVGGGKQCIARMDYQLLTKQVTDVNEHRWHEAVARSRHPITGAPIQDGWRDLGYVIHLLEDLTSPAHVRNDAHPVPWPPLRESDYFEYYNKGEQPSLPQLPLQYAFARVSRVEDLFQQLAKWTRSNFYTTDTIPAFEDYSTTPPIRVVVGPGTFPTAGGSSYLLGPCLTEGPQGEPWAFECAAGHRRLAHQFNGPWGVSETIAKEQFKELGPVAVKYVASLIEFYADRYGPEIPFRTKVTVVPSVTSAGIVNAASYISGGVAPGELIAVFGSNLAPAGYFGPASMTPTDRCFPLFIGGTRVLFDGVPAPLLYVSQFQIGAIVPNGVAGRASVQVQVESFGTLSSSVTVPVRLSHPGVFTTDQSGRSQVAASNVAVNQYRTLNSSTNPAPRGSTIELYIAGGGQMNPAVDDGTVISLSSTPPRLQSRVSATIGGIAASVAYAGAVPGSVAGLSQINIVIPDGAPTGAAIPVFVTIGDASSQSGATIAVSTASGPISVPFAMEFINISSGEFMMGCSQGDANCQSYETPSHRVRITKSFQMGKYEVTQRQWEGVMNANPSASKGQDRPVESITWSEIQEFLTKLNARKDGYRYRLPTEAEWEYCARAGTTDRLAGGTSMDEVAWQSTNSGSDTHPVGLKKPNPWGLYDVLGNVEEICQDWYDPNYYAASPTSDPPGPASGQYRIVRGGSWGSAAQYIRVANRNWWSPDAKERAYGTRLVRETAQ